MSNTYKDYPKNKSNNITTKKRNPYVRNKIRMNTILQSMDCESKYNY